VHALGGEDQATLVFVHFLLLFGANMFVYAIGARLFGRGVAAVGMAALVGIEELAFMRHYTVTLLSENLYFFTVALTLYAFVRFVDSGALRWLAGCAIAGGVSALTRPAMMLYFVPAALIVMVATYRHSRSVRRSALSAALFCAHWLAAVSPATMRNYVAAGSPVLICSSPVASFINYNLPPGVDGKVYRDRYTGTTWSLAAILGNIVVSYPVDTLRSVWTKIGFSLGMVRWMGGKAHPELLAASAGYLLAILLSPSARYRRGRSTDSSWRTSPEWS
jgi:Dolichyl-phosphate-mannose-protein mannosyltransferase